MCAMSSLVIWERGIQRTLICFAFLSCQGLEISQTFEKKTRISLCKHAVWLERVEEGSIQAVLWVTAFILLHYLQEQFWQVQQIDRLWYAIEISDKAQCCQNNLLFTHFPWCILMNLSIAHAMTHLIWAVIMRSVNFTTFDDSHECNVFTSLKWGMQVPSEPSI